MESKSKIKNQNESIRASMVHFVLSQSYFLYLYTIIIGFILGIVFPIVIFSGIIYQYIGIFLIVFGTFLIYWANKTSHSFHKTKPGNRKFFNGPYKYTRSPVHIGLSLMTLGLGFVFYSIYIVFLFVLLSCISKIIFLPKEEKLLEEKYGEEYSEYKRMFKI